MKNLAKILHSFVKHGEFVLSSGQKSNVYFDIKETYGDSTYLNLTTDMLYELFPKETDCVAGIGLGGLTLATAVSSRWHLRLCLIRDEIKTHGTRKQIEGYVPSEKDKVAIVDDVFTTGETLRKAIKVLEPTKAKLVGCYVVVKRGEGELNIPLNWLLTWDDLLETSQ